VFRRIAVFAGSFSLEAAEVVCDVGSSLDLLHILTSLLDRSLLRPAHVGGEPRFAMLETIREFASEQLAGPAMRK
jgi:predicted ATPase